MGGIDVDHETLDSIARDLRRGAAGMEDLADGVPEEADAGPMTAVIASMLSQIVDSAGNVSDSMNAAAEMVRLSGRYYQRADADAAAGLDEVRQAMTQ